VESLRLLNETGIPAIQAHVAHLQGRLLDALQATPWAAEVARLRGLGAAGRLGSILSFHHSGRGPEAMERLLRSGYRQGIFASVREGYLRVAFHGFHTNHDVDRVAAWLGGAGAP